jgi:hypothetical protein
MLRFFFITAFFLVSKMVFSQENTNGNYLFKMWLFIEKANVMTRTSNEFPIKDSSLFNFFNNNIQIRSDKIESKVFPNDYIFLQISYQLSQL